MASAHGRVIVVGSSNTDLVVRVAKLPGPGETVLGGDLDTFAGGKGANQAIAAARAGARVVFMGAFGSDAQSTARRRDLEAEGVDCSRAVTKRYVAGGVAMIAVRSGGRGRAENSIVVSPGANSLLTANDVRRNMPKLGPRDVVLCSLEVPLAPIVEAMRTGRRAGATVVLNPAPLPPRALARAVLALPSFVTPNQVEFEALIGSRARRDRGKLLGIGPDLIVTRGSLGVEVFQNGLAPWVIRPPKVRAVDAVGAGDCFNGAFSAALARNPGDVASALRFAVAASALSVTRRGAQASMPSRRDILACVGRTSLAGA
jgi:ribokinase